MIKTFLLPVFIFIIQLSSIKAHTVSANAGVQTVPADSTRLALIELTRLKSSLLKNPGFENEQIASTISRMLKIGMWKDAKQLMNSPKLSTVNHQLLKAEYLVLINDFKKAKVIVKEVLNKHSKNEKAVLLSAFLEIQAWRLPEAAKLTQIAIRNNPGSEAAEIMQGRILLLQKDYRNALAIAQKVLQQNSKNAEAYLLEADVYFWNQQPEHAERLLIRSLELDPFNADARFSYGYAIWRRVDATQLNAMAAQWELALEINPLHYQTHWHWGNGHTNLTYADYAEKNDEEVRTALAKADDLVKSNDLQNALKITREVEKQYPNSVLPLMYRGSIFYNAFNLNRELRLDSAEKIFKQILIKKKHYGPAHNGLSAVIKSKRIPYLAVYDSVTAALNHTQISDLQNFTRVFPDVSYYPGETAKAMVWNQLYSSVVYFPFLSRQGDSFRIPPLHHDLAITMNAPSFRYMTTFDNRQWMDIRGVGSGAAAIEYVERGAFLERNVVLHEYVHLFHGTVLTDAENRKIRALYYNAMKEGRTLDYYSQNNESEYFAQTYPAYFEAVKVHPLDFKSMNTTADLKSKDPEMYQFIDQLVKKEKAYLSGDKKAMASNWAEVYVNLSNKYGNSESALAYLDTALVYDAKYLPAYLSMAKLDQYEGNFKAAEEWLQKAKGIDAKYAPIYVAYAGLIAAKYQANEISQEDAIREQAEYLRQSVKLETDYQELAKINLMLREMYRKHAKIKEAIEVSDEYVNTGATVSTYLRDKRDDAVIFSAMLRSELGEKESSAILAQLVSQKPQNFDLRSIYADALAVNEDYLKAIETIREAQRVLNASGNARSDYNLRLAEFYSNMNNQDSASVYLGPFLTDKWQVRGADQLRYIRLLAKMGYDDKAKEIFDNIGNEGNHLYMADYYYTLSKLKEAELLKMQTGGSSELKESSLAKQKDEEKKIEECTSLLQKAIAFNPYHLKAYRALINYAKAKKLNSRVAELELKLKEFNLR